MREEARSDAARGARRSGMVVAGGVAIVVGLLAGALVLISRLIAAFGAVSAAEASLRARILEDGIRAAVVLGAEVGGGLVLIGVGLVAFGARRARR